MSSIRRTLKHSTVVITGASAGVGRATALAFARARGARRRCWPAAGTA